MGSITYIISLTVCAMLRVLRLLQTTIYADGTIPCPGIIVKALLQQIFGDDKLQKLEYLTWFYHRYGLFTFDGKVYIFNERYAQTAINKLEKGAEHYLDDSPLKDTFLGSSQKSPETRRAIASIFRKSSINEKGFIMLKDVDNLCNKIANDTPGPVNVTQWSLKFALDIVGHVLLQLNFQALEGRQDQLLECMMTVLHRCYALNEITSDSKEFVTATENFDEITRHVLEEALNQDDSSTEGKKLVQQLHSACGFEQAKENMKLFLMAGSETTGSTLPVIFYLLTKYPNLQLELQREADENIEAIRKDPTTPLPKTESMMKEVLRLYPIAPFISRKNEESFSLGKIRVKENTDIIVFTWGIHRSPYTWDKSTSFIPFRFLHQGSLKDNSNMFIPFGAGSRVCIGQHLAWLEIKLVVSVLLNKFNFQQTAETPDLRFVVDWAHAVVHPYKDMLLQVSSRVKSK